MPKLPKLIQDEADLRAVEKALNDPDPTVSAEATRRLLETTLETIDPSGQLLRPFKLKSLEVIESGLNEPVLEKRLEMARWVLSKGDTTGLPLLERKPELGIERAREIVRIWKEEVEQEEKLHPPN